MIMINCPFCGNTDIYVGTVAEAKEEENPNEWDETHYTAICDASRGHKGCGASIGWNCETYEEAVDRWNKRATDVTDCKQRMVNEYNEAKDRYNKLHRMIAKYDAGTLDFKLTYPIDLLRELKDVIGRYLNVFEIRAEAENINLDNLMKGEK